jgi:hypothetical protein
MSRYIYVVALVKHEELRQVEQYMNPNIPNTALEVEKESISWVLTCAFQLHMGPGHRVILSAVVVHDTFYFSTVGKCFVPLILYSSFISFYLLCPFRFETRNTCTSPLN